MAQIKGIALTEKGVVKTAVRNGIIEMHAPKIESMSFERVENKNIFYKEYVDSKGNVVYATITLTVGTSNPTIEKSKATKSKSKKVETFSIED